MQASARVYARRKENARCADDQVEVSVGESGARAWTSERSERTYEGKLMSELVCALFQSSDEISKLVETEQSTYVAGVERENASSGHGRAETAKYGSEDSMKRWPSWTELKRHGLHSSAATTNELEDMTPSSHSALSSACLY